MATPSSYQRVGATAADYDASAGVTQVRFDGIDDALASATFTANTVLTDGMTALIAVRRDSTAACVAGIYSLDGSNHIGYVNPGAVGNYCFLGVGTPTVWVDNVQLTGGTNVSADTLNTALSPGDIHIMEFRGLNLSTWVNLGAGGYPLYGLQLNGGLGEIMLFANPAESDLNLARAQMAQYFGVTLP